MPTSNDDPPPAGDEIHGVAERTMEAAAAVRRRNALAAFLHGRRLTEADLSRAIGLVNANLLYNFKHGRTNALSLGVIERILDRFPETTFEELTGRRPRAASRAPTTNRFLDPHVMIVGEVAAGVAVPRGGTAPSRWKRLPLPLGATHPGPGGFAVIVGSPGAEAAYPVGSVLVCRLYRPGAPLPPGTRVIVRRRLEAGVEFSVRQATSLGAETWLVSLSTHPEHQEALRLPTARNGEAVRRPPGYRVDGVVTWAWMPQGVPAS